MRCQPTGGVWVDSAMDLDAAENRTRFILRHGNETQISKSILAEFRVHGEEAFTFEILEKLDDDVAQMSIRDLLKERKLHWLQQVGAQKLAPF